MSYYMKDTKHVSNTTCLLPQYMQLAKRRHDREYVQSINKAQV